jgi:hypothetical protein
MCRFQSSNDGAFAKGTVKWHTPTHIDVGLPPVFKSTTLTVDAVRALLASALLTSALLTSALLVSAVLCCVCCPSLSYLAFHEA